MALQRDFAPSLELPDIDSCPGFEFRVTREVSSELSKSEHTGPGAAASVWSRNEM
jgi:hypothetical protein